MPTADDVTVIATARTGSGAAQCQSPAGLLARSLFPAPSPQEPEARAGHGGPGEPAEDDPHEALRLALTSLPIY